MERVLAGLTHGGRAIADRINQANEIEGAIKLSQVVQEDPASAENVGTTRFDYLFDRIVDDPDKHLPADYPRATVKALTDLGHSMVEPPGLPSLDPRAIIFTLANLGQSIVENPQLSLIKNIITDFGLSIADIFNTDNSPIPPIYTYWGQFIDHDITANTDRDSKVSDITVADLRPLAPTEVKENLKNLRVPMLNLDSVYGDGPFKPRNQEKEGYVPYDGIKLSLGEVDFPITALGKKIDPVDDLARDLPRRQGDPDPERNGVALIGDARDDENLIIAQLHVAFLRFHNAAVDWVRANEPGLKNDNEVFDRARNLTTWSYQWLVVNDYLKTVTVGGVVDRVLNSSNNLLRLDQQNIYMPLEFSVAAFRFGHSMIRQFYDWNRNFGDPGIVLPFAPLTLLFRFTGKPKASSRLNTIGLGISRATRLPFNWIAEWDRMIYQNPRFPNRSARKIDTKVAFSLSSLSNEDDPNPRLRERLKQLAVRNLLRGYLLSLPTGQAVAEELGIPVLTRQELERGSSDDMKKALKDGGFFTRTPLWFYILKESEVRAQGKSIGEVGSRIVAETIIGHIRNDPQSYINNNWKPEDGVRLRSGAPVKSIEDFLLFGGVLVRP